MLYSIQVCNEIHLNFHQSRCHRRGQLISFNHKCLSEGKKCCQTVSHKRKKLKISILHTCQFFFITWRWPYPRWNTFCGEMSEFIIALLPISEPIKWQFDPNQGLKLTGSVFILCLPSYSPVLCSYRHFTSFK